MERKPSRRTFLKRTAEGGIGGLVVLASGPSARSYAASEKLHLAHIGVGGRGRELLRGLHRQEISVALCDVNEKKATEMYRKLPGLPKFHDFRVMLDKMRDEIDAVVVATPDHTHAVASAAAIKAGKHVYTEKPLTRTVHESRALRDLARKHKVATSMGNQGTSSPRFRRALELIRNGTLGAIKEVHTWNDHGGPDLKETPKGEAKIPPYLKWDLWLGPNPARPFHPKWMAWHSWREFGTCQLGNWASHTQNLAFMALKVHTLWDADPATKPIITVEGNMPGINRLSFPRWEQVRWDIPKRGDLPPISFTWHNGSRRPRMREELEALMGRGLDWGDKGEKKWADWAGCLIIGTEGKIYATGHNATFSMMPAEKFKDVQQERPETVQASRGHSGDWFIACRGGKPAWACYDYAGPLTEFNMLGNVATQFGEPLEFDPLACKIVNNAEADKALHEHYREGWSL